MPHNKTTSPRPTRPSRFIRTAALGLALTAAGCAASANQVASVPGTTAPTHGETAQVAVEGSMYCRAVAGHHPDESSYANFWEYWTAVRQYETQALWTAPDPIREDWRTVATHDLDVLTPRYEAADYKAITVEAPPAEVTDAQSRIAAFDRDVCRVR